MSPVSPALWGNMWEPQHSLPLGTPVLWIAVSWSPGSVTPTSSSLLYSAPLVPCPLNPWLPAPQCPGSRCTPVPWLSAPQCSQCTPIPQLCATQCLDPACTPALRIQTSLIPLAGAPQSPNPVHPNPPSQCPLVPNPPGSQIPQAPQSSRLLSPLAQRSPIPWPFQSRAHSSTSLLSGPQCPAPDSLFPIPRFPNSSGSPDPHSWSP